MFLRRYLSLLLFTAALAACQAAPTSPTATDTFITPSVALNSPSPPTETVTPTAPPATASPSPTPSPTPAPTSTPTPLACWQEGGKIESDSLSSKNLVLPMEFRVYLPPCYEEQPDRRYPVLYLIHGQNYNEDQWDRMGADEAASELVAQGAVSPFLIVMPRDRYWVQPTESTFGTVLIEELIPLIDERYRTLPERSHRAIGGLSRGASWAVHLGLSEWELFGAIGAHSLPVFWTDTPHVRSWLDAIPEEALPRIFMDTGEKDYLLRSTLWFEGLLTEKGIPHEWYLFPGYHEEAYWESHLEQYLKFYAAEW